MFVRFTLPLCFALFASVALAQTSSESCLRDFASVIQPDATLTANFQLQKQLPGIKRVLPAQGRVVVNPGTGLIWQTSFPLEQIRVFGKTRFAMTDEKGELKVREHKAAEQISELLTRGRDELISTLKQSFFVTCKHTGKHFSVLISPKTGTLADLLTEVSLEAQNNTITRTSIVQTDGTITRIRFDTVQLPALLSERDAALFKTVR